MTTIGDSCSSRATTGFEGATVIWRKISFAEAGHITSWCCYVNVIGKAKLKIFRDDGTNYVFIGESALLDLVAGLNSGLAADINALSGDFIGIYLETSSFHQETGSSTYVLNFVGATDVSTTTAKSGWSSVSRDFVSLAVTYTSLLTDVYVDINKSDDTGDGLAFATAKKTMKAGWDILASTGTMHVASGDYSAQTTIAYNKSWKLSCEDPNSVGYKIVKIPKST